jgi:D-sedoheptulose 7-phosphate isomerase
MTDPIQELYPWLTSSGSNAAPARDRTGGSAVSGLDRLDEAGLLESIRQKTEQSRDASRAFFADNERPLLGAARALAGVFRRGRMLAMGNGGSSCDAAHFAVEFLHPITTGRPALPALNLVMDTAMLSAVGNDIGMRHVFRRQVEAHARSGDGLIGFSTSGNSENLLSAYEKAKQLGLVTFGLAGADGGAMKSSGLVDHLLVVQTDSVHRVQEVHLVTYHLLWDLTHTVLADARGPIEPGHVQPEG